MRLWPEGDESPLPKEVETLATLWHEIPLAMLAFFLVPALPLRPLPEAACT